MTVQCRSSTSSRPSQLTRSPSTVACARTSSAMPQAATSSRCGSGTPAATRPGTTAAPRCATVPVLLASDAAMSHCWSCRSTSSIPAILRSAASRPDSGSRSGTRRPWAVQTSRLPGRTVNSGTSPAHRSASSCGTSARSSASSRASVHSRSSARSRSSASRATSGCVVSSSAVAYVRVARVTNRTGTSAHVRSSSSSSARWAQIVSWPTRNPASSAVW